MTLRTLDKEQFDAALVNPSTLFDCPRDVVGALGISDFQKIEILRCWDYDVRLEEVAQEENMSGDLPVHLSDIFEALNMLGAKAGHEHPSPTKQRG